ncbi:hypothetical protein P7C70_g3629, partial [Phenoliferia sp. Uapishka_3]
MAKSLKSKSMRQFRKIKRDDPKYTPPLSSLPSNFSLHPLFRSAFRVAEDARLARLSNKLQESLAKPKALTDAEEYRRKKEGIEDIEGETPVPSGSKDMEVDGSAAVEGDAEAEGEDNGKVSTSGPRMSRRETYRTAKKFQVRLKPNTLFRGLFATQKLPSSYLYSHSTLPQAVEKARRWDASLTVGE